MSDWSQKQDGRRSDGEAKMKTAKQEMASGLQVVLLAARRARWRSGGGVR